MKLLAMLMYSFLVFTTKQKATILLSFLVALLLCLISKKEIKVFKYGIVYVALLVCDYAANYITNDSVNMILGVLVYSVMKFLPLILLGHWFISTIEISEFVTAMELMHIPRTIVLPFAVLIRFLPTVKEELRHIRNTMKMRNINATFLGAVFQPIKTMEYILVPLLMRSIKISEELSAAAVTRCIESETKRIPLREVKIKHADIILTILFTLLVIGLWCFDKTFSSMIFSGLIK